MAAVNITTANFQSEVLESKETVLIDFWASWCGPCRMLSPVVDQVADEVSGVKVGKVNVDEQMELAQQYGVTSIPCLVVFKDGKEVNRSVGVVPKSRVLDRIKV